MEELKHECGVAMIRLRRSLEYYTEKYGTPRWALDKLYLLMEKQHNRGQEGAGIACVKLDAAPGEEYMFRERAAGTSGIQEVFAKAGFIGEVYMGHLRYSTTGRSGLDYVHPFLRRNNWRAKNLALCGNFNLTNVDEVFASIVAKGQHPRKYSDTHILLEQLGHRLDREVERVYDICRGRGLDGLDLTHAIEEEVDMARVLSEASPLWDGGYVMCGLTGSGETFALRDPWGIRTAFWYADDEVVVLASERPVIQTVLNVPATSVSELQPGEALLTDKQGRLRTVQVNEPGRRRACSFERIYFSRGGDIDIYRERKQLGRSLTDAVLEAVDGDIANTVVSYIPNTAETAFFGLIEGLDEHLNRQKIRLIEALGERPDTDVLEKILSMRIRSEKVAIKDIKLRTFISEGASRDDLATHVYDITYGSLRPGVDSLVIIDDSIVRGTTLRQSIIRILDRLHPRRTVIVSSSPQIRYPDYYGIDMSSLEQFIAFKAAVSLLRARGMDGVLDDIHRRIADGRLAPGENPVKAVYAPFTDAEISAEIARLLTPDDVGTEVRIIFQTVDGLHQACPDHLGDWYFTGDYPTAGGLRMLCRAYQDWYAAQRQTPLPD